MEEARERFGTFRGSERRARLWTRFAELMREARASQAVVEVLVDGSFVTSKTDPNDLDLVLVVPANHDFSADLPIAQYNVLAQRRVRQRFGFDIIVVKTDTENLEQAIAFFQQVRQEPDLKKGLLRIRI